MLSSLYKYQTLSAYSLASLVNGTVWLAKPKSFNDPFDCALTLDRSRYKESVMHAITVAMERAKPLGLKRKQLVDIWPGDKEAFEEFRDNLKNLFQEIGILCLSEVPNSMLMWSHYANHHRGFCVEYDFNASSQLRMLADKVQYSDEIPSLTAADFDGPNKEKATDSLWLTKASCWSYEQEWRVMMTHGDRAYQAPSSIQSVTFGARMPEADRTMITYALRHAENIQFKEAVLSEQSFIVEVREC
jgi:Protein of unknown function (DUF2971)